MLLGNFTTTSVVPLLIENAYRQRETPGFPIFYYLHITLLHICIQNDNVFIYQLPYYLFKMLKDKNETNI